MVTALTAQSDSPPAMRLADAVTLKARPAGPDTAWFMASWPFEGPKVPTPDTVRTYGHHLDWFVRFAAARGKVDVTQTLEPTFVREALKATLEARGGRHPTFKGGEAAAAGLAHATRKMAGWLLAQGVPVADLKEINAPRAPERIQPRLRPEEFAALEQVILRQLVDGHHANPRATVARDLALLYLLSDTGLRAGEVCRMRVEDINFERGTAHIYGKGRKQRVLLLVDPDDPAADGGRTLRLLAEWLRQRNELRRAREHEFVWTSLWGNPLPQGEMRKILRRHGVAAGLDGNRPPHAFRRGNFTENYRADPRRVKLLAARMGWSEKSQHMVAIYTRGAELEIAAEQPLPSLASRWHLAGSEPRVPTVLPWQRTTASELDVPSMASVWHADGQPAPRESGGRRQPRPKRTSARSRSGGRTDGLFARLLQNKATLALAEDDPTILDDLAALIMEGDGRR